MQPTTFFKAFSLSVILFSFAACVPDPDDVIDPNNTSAAISAKVDGQVFNAITKTAKLSGNALTIEGINSQGESIVLKTNSGLATGTYPLNVSNTGEYFLSQTTAAFATGNPPAVGSLIIDNITTDSLITGTFNFLGIRATDNLQRTITEGVFTSLKVKKDLGGTMSATVDGSTNWAATNLLANISGSNLIITANGGGRTVLITVPVNVAAATYNVNSLSAYKMSYSLGSSLYPGISGSLVITTHDTADRHIVGTFNNCVMSNVVDPAINLTNGSFDVYY